jgi:hypothetical protein
MQRQKEKDNYPSEIGSQNAFLMAILHAALRDFSCHVCIHFMYIVCRAFYGIALHELNLQLVKG